MKPPARGREMTWSKWRWTQSQSCAPCSPATQRHEAKQNLIIFLNRWNQVQTLNLQLTWRTANAPLFWRADRWHRTMGNRSCLAALVSEKATCFSWSFTCQNCCIIYCHILKAVPVLLWTLSPTEHFQFSHNLHCRQNFAQEIIPTSSTLVWNWGHDHVLHNLTSRKKINRAALEAAEGSTQLQGIDSNEQQKT